MKVAIILLVVLAVYSYVVSAYIHDIDKAITEGEFECEVHIGKQIHQFEQCAYLSTQVQQ